MTATQKTRNWALSWGVSPGLSRFSPVSVDIDQLLCLPEPLIPANGFSCGKHAREDLGAVLRINSIISICRPSPGLEAPKAGRSPHCSGAPSLDASVPAPPACD